MRVILISILFSNFLFPVGGVIIFNDGTTIEGDVTNVDQNSIFITPMGLTFPEEIRMENVDSLKLYDGKLLVANNKALILYANGEYFEPGLSEDNSYEEYEAYLGEIGPNDHIDHIIPLKYYNLHDPVDQRKAFNHQNTRIVSAADNRAKSDSLPPTEELNELRHLWPNSWGVSV